LLQTLAPAQAWGEQTLLFEHGDRNWFNHLEAIAVTAIIPTQDRPARIVFRSAETQRRRGLKHVAPSQREGAARLALKRLFDPVQETGKAIGSLFHAWFATIDWLDDGLPSDAALKSAAESLGTELPAEISNQVERFMSEFRGCLQKADIRSVLQRSTYASPDRPGFPTALAPIWTKSLAPQKAERERRFLVHDGEKFWNGYLDRIVWITDGGKLVAADIIDFKTDAIQPGDTAALTERTEFYRPQLEAYRRAVARMAHLQEDHVAIRLVFTAIGRIVDL